MEKSPEEVDASEIKREAEEAEEDGGYLKRALDAIKASYSDADAGSQPGGLTSVTQTWNASDEGATPALYATERGELEEKLT